MLAMKSKVLTLSFATAIVLTGCQTTVMPPVKPVNGTILDQEVKQTLVIMYNASVDKTTLMQMIKRYHGVITHEYPSLNGIAIIFPAGTNMGQAMTDLKAIAGVTSVEQDGVMTAQ